jgi:hypothetical protein
MGGTVDVKVWSSVALLALGVTAACSEEGGENGADLDGNAGAGAAQAAGAGATEAGAAGQADGSMAGAGGQADSGQPGVGGNAGGAAGEAPNTALGGAGGAPGDDGGAAGMPDGLPDGPYVLCPDVGEKVELLASSELTESELALAEAFGCPLNDLTSRNFTVERFELNQTRFEVLASAYYIGNYDMFTVRPDCGPLGYITPFAYSEYRSLYAETLGPGIYTRVSCELSMEVFDEPVPPSPTNVDCAHAKPLPKSTSYYPDEPTAVLDESRVGDNQARFYSFSLPSDPDFPDETWDVSINTGYSYDAGGGADVKLYGPDNGDEHASFIFRLDGEMAASFDAIAPGKYCVEFSVAKGVKYSIYYQAHPTP